jgi:16S rRNA pseudouridine516 synthase
MTHATARLDQLLAGMGYGTRREVAAWMDANRILLDGQPIFDSRLRVVLDASLTERLTVDGAPIDPLPGMVVMLHKPLGTTCSHKESGPLIYDIFPERWKRRAPKLSSVGRLDKDTSGLLLLTDDGMLLHKIISPKQHVAKRYRATLARPLRADAEAICASGTLLLEGETAPCLPSVLVRISETEAMLTLHEGRYHQVRRMFAALDNRVVTLHREAIGGLELPEDLPAGAYRLLSAEAIQRVFARG